MFNPMKWWRNRRWVYLGYSELFFKNDNKKDAGVLHFWAWQSNMKRRKVKYSKDSQGVYYYNALRTSSYYNIEIVPWLEGGDMWKPIEHPVAVKGQLIDFYKGQQ